MQVFVQWVAAGCEPTCSLSEFCAHFMDLHELDSCHVSLFFFVFVCLFVYLSLGVNEAVVVWDQNGVNETVDVSL
jgi:hypothetical protein